MRSASRGFLGPHDRRALAFERQDRERPGGQEMLLGAAVVIALVRHRGDDAGLAVGPAEALDAGALADAGARAVGRDQQPRRRRRCRRRSAPRRWLRRRSRNPSRRSARSSTPCCFALPASASISGRFSIMWANGSPGSTSPPKVRNTGRTASLSLESVTTMSRIGCASPRPHPRRRWSRTAAAPPPRWRRRAHRRNGSCPAPDRRPRPRTTARAPAAAQSPARARQSRRRRSGHRTLARCVPLCLRHRRSISLRHVLRRPGPARPSSISSRSRSTCSAAAARRSAGSACSAAR